MTTSDQPMDHAAPGDESGSDSQNNDLEKHVTAKSTWIRLFFMVLFAVLYGISRIVTGAVVVIQFFHVLLTGETNERLKTFGHSLALYSFQVVDYLTFNTETKPFPLDEEWPTGLSDIDSSTRDDAQD
jgi:hypothetical protein